MYCASSPLQVCKHVTWPDSELKYRLANDLGAHDTAIMRQLSFKLKHHLTDAVYDDLPFTFPTENTPSIDSARTRLASLAGIKPVLYDCCPQSCCAHTGSLSELTACPHCHTPRYAARGRARKHYTYLPLIPRLVAQVQSPRMADKMRYRGEYKHKPGQVSDVFDGTRYRRLCQLPVTIDGKELPHKHFSDTRDIALGASTDGFAPFRRRKTTCW
ncbi:hypothetical protein OF83DRAFT_1072537, partial [Amylostereum chailletii]